MKKERRRRGLIPSSRHIEDQVPGGRDFDVASLTQTEHFGNDWLLDPVAFVRTAQATQARHRQRSLDVGILAGKIADALVRPRKRRAARAREQVRT